jgi:N-methylhydantoinase B
MSAADVVWDGVQNCYVPPATLDIDPRLKLHTEAADVDPFVYEVLRHSIWNINDEHGMTVIKVSGSPIAYSAEDMATTIMTESAEFVFLGGQNQMLSGFVDLQAKWILENRSGGEGIHDGDMFLGNDPWIGSTHQQDVVLLCPVFWEGELFCWVASALHQYDIGGSTPGGFCPDARDCFMEAVSIPPVKIVANNELRPDIEQFYLRHSRMPDLVALDLRAQLAGNLGAKNRILDLCRRYGAATVKGAMRKIIDDAERAFASKIERLPDGEFHGRSYIEAAQDGDRQLYPVCLQVTKEGRTLTFGMEGSAPQTGALNMVYAAWRSALLASVNPLLSFDLMYAIGGPLRCIEFEPVAGTICCASYPASVSNPQGPGLISGALATGALSRMMSFDPELAKATFAPGAVSTFLIDSLSGTDQWGGPFGTILLDPMLGGTGGFTHRDGIDTAGVWWCPRSMSPNVEDNERNYPILYLYRREWIDSGGAGRHRGGNSAAAAFVAHGTSEIEHSSASPGVSVPTSEGVFGGGPGSPSRFRLVTGTEVQERLRNGGVPQDIDAIGGEHQTADDVIEIAWGAGGGMGDPLDRPPEEVLRSVLAGDTSVEWAARRYGVVVVDGKVDDQATEARRAEIRDERRAGTIAEPAAPGSGEGAAAVNGGRDGGEVRLRMADVLDVIRHADGRFEYRCAECGTSLGGPGATSYKHGAAMVEHALTDHVPHSELAVQLVDDRVVVRDFSCPGCARLLASEVSRATDDIVIDIQLASTGARSTEPGDTEAVPVTASAK